VPDWSSLTAIRRIAVALLAVCVVAPLGAVVPAFAPASPQEPEAQVRMNGNGGRVALRVVAGRLVLECDISTPYRRIPANLFLSPDTACGLQLHNRAAAPLRAESADGKPTPITIHFPDFSVTVPKREHGNEDDLDDFTKYHSQEMGENAVVGTIGAELLQEFGLVIDLPHGFFELTPAADPQTELPPAVAPAVRVPLTLRAGLSWLPVRLESGRTMAMALGGSRYDTLIDADLADDLGHPDGKVGAVTVGGLDLAPYVAFRPELVILSHPDGAFGLFGINLYEHFRVEIDRVHRSALLVPSRAPAFPQADLAFFQTRLEDTPAATLAFLEANPETRLAGEAATLLLQQQLDSLAPAAAVKTALEWSNRTTPEDLRATAALDRMKELADDGWPDYELAMGEIGIESGRQDRYPDAVHKIHARLGEVYLDRDELDQAWRHLLSAAFGLPEDGLINLALGRCYEAQGRYRRAFSRYIQAAIAPESGPQAIDGLRRMQPKLPEEDPFSVELVERLIEGKVMNFGSASHWKADPEHPTTRTTLVEFFTNGQYEFAQAGGVAFEGLTRHFDEAPVALLSYHLPPPGLEPLVNPLALQRAKAYQITEPNVVVIDGTVRGPGAGRLRDREAIFRSLRDKAEKALEKPTPWTMDLSLSLDGDQLQGSVTARGPEQEARSLRLHVVLAERAVLYPGESKIVVHRMVARAALTPTDSGAKIELQDGQLRFPFAVMLSELEQENKDWLDAQIAAGKQSVKMSLDFDPKELLVVAWLQDPFSGKVAQATIKRLYDPEDSL